MITTLTAGNNELRDIRDRGKVTLMRAMRPQPVRKADGQGWMFGEEYFADDKQMRDHLHGNGQCPYGDILLISGTGVALRLVDVSVDFFIAWCWVLDCELIGRPKGGSDD